MSNCRQTWRIQTMSYPTTNTKINPCSCLCVVKSLVVGALSARLSVYIPRVCPHGNSDQSKNSSGSMLLLLPQTHFTSDCSFFMFFIILFSQYSACHQLMRTRANKVRKLESTEMHFWFWSFYCGQKNAEIYGKPLKNERSYQSC